MNRRNRGRQTNSDLTPIAVEKLENRLLLTPVTQTNDSFENGLPAHWSIPNIAGEGRVSIRNVVTEQLIEVGLSNQFSTAGNQNALVFDSSRASGDSVDDLAVAIMEVDLSAASSALLTFHQLEGVRGDINDELPVRHLLETGGDGISISSNGTDWYTLENVQGNGINRGGDGLWQLFEVDLIANIQRLNADENAGLTTASTLQIKFSQFDDDSYPRRGWAIDNVQLRSTASTFTLDEPRGVFHRFNLAGEDDSDYYYRAAVFGDVDASTPILISTHGSSGDANYTGYSRNWHRFVADPANGVDSLIVVSPAFVESTGAGRFNDPHRYTALSWNTTDNAAADLALLDTVDTISATGIGNANGLYMWGFSAGGQFTGRFTAAHPDRVAAAVVGGPASQILPYENVTFPWGLGTHPTLPPPDGVTLDREDYLQSRIMYWVGQDDNDPDHPDLSRAGDVDSVQGLSRLQRSVNQFDAMYTQAGVEGFADSQFEYELFISEGNGHNWGSANLPTIYEFLSREHDANESAVRIHPRIVSTGTVETSQTWLPESVTSIAVGEQFQVELWVESQDNNGVRSGSLDVYFDSDVATATAVDSGHFSTAFGGTIDNANGRIRGLTGTTSDTDAGVNGYALLGRISLTAAANLTDSSQLLIAAQRDAQSEFELTSGQTRRTDLLPFASTTIHPVGSGASLLQGMLFADSNADGVRQATESGLANRPITLAASPAGAVAVNQFSVEPDDFPEQGAYINDFAAAVSLSAIGSEVAGPGVQSSIKVTDESSTGVSVFAARRNDGGFNSLFVQGRRELRMDFALPTSSVSIDVIAKLNDASDLGQLDVYGANGQLLQTVNTQTLSDGAFETLTITRNTPDIAWAIAYGLGDQNVRLDNVTFSSELSTTTDSIGNYRLDGFAAGSYYLATSLSGSEFQTSGPTPETAVVVGTQSTTSADIGIHVSTLVAGPNFEDATVSEGTSTTHSLSLSAPPASAVTYFITSADTNEVLVSPASVTFDQQNWNVPQQVSLTAIDDFLIDETVSTTVSVFREQQVLSTFEWTVFSDDVAGLVLSESDDATQVNESGGSDSFGIALSAEPTSNVTVVLNDDFNPNQVSFAPQELIFTPDNWMQEQTVTVSALDDSVVDGDVIVPIQIAVDSSRSDADFGSVSPASLQVTAVDNEVAGYSVTLTGNDTTTSEAGGSDTFSVVLNQKPAANVVFSVQALDVAEATVDVASLTFTTNNWDTPQVVRVTGVDDDLADGDVTTQVEVRVLAQSQQAFQNLPNESVDVVTSDDDVAGFVISQSSNSTVVDESGTTDTIEITLTARPLTDVVLVIANDDEDERTVNTPSISFTPDNWSVPQTVTVTGVDDSTIDMDQRSDLQVSVDVAQSAAAFSGVAQQTVSITTTDDDTAEFVVSTTQLDVSESGAVAQFSVSLSAAPLTDVVVSISSEDDEEVRVSGGQLTFTSANWGQPQSVSVTGVDDQRVDGSQLTNVAISVDAANSDSAFHSTPSASVSVSNSDNDTAGFQLSTSAVSVSESGTAGTVTISLTAAPVTSVVIQVASVDSGEVAVSPSSVTFNAENWDTPQPVSLTGVDDEEVDGSKVTSVSFTIDAGSSDAAFGGVAGQAVSVTTTDDDVSDSGDIDGDADFDANDSFMIHLLQLSGSDPQIEQSKGSSQLSAQQIRQNLAALSTTGDVDGDGDFDANDSFMIHLVKLSGSDLQVDQSKGQSVLTAQQIRTNINALGSDGSQQSVSAAPVLKAVFADDSRPQAGLFVNSARTDSTAENERDSDDSANFPIVDSHVWAEFRSWIDTI